MDGACLYAARVAHRRWFPVRYRFVYRLCYLLLDIDRIDADVRRLRFFSHNRLNLAAFHDADHGDGRTPLRAWAERLLADRGIDLAGGRIRLLTLPRVLGFVFNPVSFWFCQHADGSLRAIIAEVNNTFGERHFYLLASAGRPLPYRQAMDKEKCFHVSPFMDLRGRYRFVVAAPGERLAIAIREYQDQRPQLLATLIGERRPLTDAALLGQLLRMPLMTFKVVAAIHWQALKIWLSGARFHRKPPPTHEVS